MLSGLLLDLSGVLYIEDQAIAGAVDSLHRLQQAGLSIRYVTNTTRSPRTRIHQQLTTLGFNLDINELFTAPMAAHAYLVEHSLYPYMLIHPDLMVEFEDRRRDDDQHNAVLIGDADQAFTYNNMNTAFRKLMQGLPLISMGKNRYFKQSDGLSIDAGAFVVALEYASHCQAIVTGKPEREFFVSAASSMDCQPEQVIMIGDDIESDINGASETGMLAILVQTGKYRRGDENKFTQPSSSYCLADINAATDYILDIIH
jgi:HAD superfamily hydrolase (TIGR01458 family)